MKLPLMSLLRNLPTYLSDWIRRLPPLRLLIYGYIFILLLGFLLLCIPFFHAAAVQTIDNLFIAASALSTTGLSTISIIDSYNLGGQIIILILIQIGGLGYMSIGSFVILQQQRRLSRKDSELIRYDFTLPEGLHVRSFIKNMIIATFAIEFIGALFLSLIFWQEGVRHPVWQGIFHSISAFCTAGFSLFNDSLEGFRHNFYLNFVIASLCISGALGFIVFSDIFERFSRRKDEITFTSKIIIRFTFTGILIGAAVIFLSDNTVAGLAPAEGLMISLFQSTTAFTTVGFHTYPISVLASGPLFFILLLMVVGASPSGTGGGMKSTTVTALYAQLRSTFRKDKEIIYRGNIIPDHRVRMAFSNFFFYTLLICLGSYLLLLLHPQDPFIVIFESISALGTVGLSLGLTPDLSILGKLIISSMMFLGRVGPLSFGIALFEPEKEEKSGEEEEAEEEDVAI